jgi:hypothetical protein
MVETPRLWPLAAALLLAGCVAPEPTVVEAPAPAPAAAPAVPAPDAAAEQARLAEEAKALLAQAETDIQRARAKRALWLPAWADLLAAREAMASRDVAGTIRHAKRASELALLGLEQLAYPAVTAADVEPASNR